jgi:hypothetical protein
MSEAAAHEIIALIRGTQVVEELVTSLEQEPLGLLAVICKAHEMQGGPVPDHRIPIQGYLGEIGIKALVQTGFIDEEPSTRDSIRAFTPTHKGSDYYLRLKNEGYYSKS